MARAITPVPLLSVFLIACGQPEDVDIDENPPGILDGPTPDAERFIDVGFVLVDGGLRVRRRAGPDRHREQWQQRRTQRALRHLRRRGLRPGPIQRHKISSASFRFPSRPRPSTPLGDADRWYQISRNPAEPARTTCHDPGSTLDPTEWPVDIVQAFVEADPDAFDIVIGQGIVDPAAPFHLRRLLRDEPGDRSSPRPRW